MVQFDTTDLQEEFRSSRNQVLETPKVITPAKIFKKNYTVVPVVHRNVTSDKYSDFLRRYYDLDNYITSFDASDLAYFFREKAKEQGIKYVIANMKRDRGIFKRLLVNYKPEEICLMIEFIFCSNQNYLDVSITQPTVLVSAWCNTLYHDAMLWLDDKYVPSTEVKSTTVSREWGEVTENSSSIGSWD